MLVFVLHSSSKSYRCIPRWFRYTVTILRKEEEEEGLDTQAVFKKYASQESSQLSMRHGVSSLYKVIREFFCVLVSLAW